MANHLVRKARQFADALIQIKPIPVTCTKFLLYTDAAWGNTVKGGSQGAYVITVVDKRIDQGKSVPMSIVQWQSGRVRRVCVSTLAAETLSLVNGLNHLEWARCFWEEATAASFALKNWELCVSKRPFTVAVDAKSVYDHLSKPTVGTGKDKRAAIDLQFAREVLSRDDSQIRWVDGRYQLADDLTKLRDGDLIRAAMRESRATLVAEDEALQQRERERELRRSQAKAKASLRADSTSRFSHHSF